MLQRSQVATLVERVLEPSERIVTIFGPRQTGKTTVVQQALRVLDEKHRMQHVYVPVDDPYIQGTPDPLAASPDAVALHGDVVMGGG